MLMMNPSQKPPSITKDDRIKHGIKIFKENTDKLYKEGLKVKKMRYRLSYNNLSRLTQSSSNKD